MIRAKRRHGAARSHGWLSARAVGRLLGREGRDAARLPGLMRRTALQVGRHLAWGTTLEDLTDWLADERWWHYWDPDRISDAALGEWASQLRAGRRFLTVGEVSARLHLTASAVNARIHRGCLRATRPGGGNWLVREDWL